VTASAASMYTYLLGGSDYLGPDRDAAEAALALAEGCPQGLQDVARANRRFVLGAVWHTAGMHRIRQFLDLGCGLPYGQAVHEMARLAGSGAGPPAVVAYADIDETAFSHARAVYRPRTPEDPGGDAGITVIQADLTAPASVLEDGRVRDLIDFTGPVAVIFGSSLYCPAGRGREVVAEYARALAPHSAVVVSAACFTDRALAGRLEACAREAGSGWRNYTPAEAAGLLDGLRVVHGRVADVSRWPVIPSWQAPVPAAMMAGGVGIVGGASAGPA
jgi:hypothetical protein